jgi:S1-C subfamily serine protease
MKLKELLADCILLAGIVIATLTISYWLAGYCTAADCINCDAGLVGRGPVKYVCPICDGVQGIQPSAADLFSSGTKDTPTVDSQSGIQTKTDHRKAVVRIVTTDGWSTGVVVGPRSVLTAWHSTRSDRNRVVVHYQTGKVASGRVIRSDERFDIAAVEVDASGVPAASIAAVPASVGSTVEAIGYGPSPMVPASYRATKAKVMMLAAPVGSNDYEMFEVALQSRGGDSGGPAFNAAGEVVGILSGTGYTRQHGHRSLFAGAARIREFLAMEPTEDAKVAAAQCPDGKCQRPGSSLQVQRVPQACPDGRCRK